MNKQQQDAYDWWKKNQLRNTAGMSALEIAEMVIEQDRLYLMAFPNQPLTSESKMNNADKEQALLKELESLTGESGDPESRHGRADDILCELLELAGHTGITEIFNRIEKWYA